MQKICIQHADICKTLHKLCLCIDFITANMQKKNAKNMLKYAKKKMQTICKQYTEYA